MAGQLTRFSAAVCLMVTFGGCSETGSHLPEDDPGELNPKESSALGDPVIIGAGDIATCNGSHDEATATLIQQSDGVVFTLGDNAYPSGTARDYQQCYDASWGGFRSRTRPAPGNHEYEGDSTGSPYFDYFGSEAGRRGEGYYSYDLGTWHIVVLNGSLPRALRQAQLEWLDADLKAHSTACVLSYFHFPLYSSGGYANELARPFWRRLYRFGADVILNGHDHLYERFAPQDTSGNLDPEHGIRQFIVGTGGGGLHPIVRTAPNSEARNDRTYGVLKLTLHQASYSWRFISVDGSYTDAGTDKCN